MNGAGGDRWGSGPTHCQECWDYLKKAGVREVMLDPALMHQVVIGVPQEGISTQNQERCTIVAQHLRWDGDKLHIKGKDGCERWVVPWCDRRKLV